MRYGEGAGIFHTDACLATLMVFPFSYLAAAPHIARVTGSIELMIMIYRGSYMMDVQLIFNKKSIYSL